MNRKHHHHHHQQAAKSGGQHSSQGEQQHHQRSHHPNFRHQNNSHRQNGGQVRDEHSRPPQREESDRGQQHQRQENENENQQENQQKPKDKKQDQKAPWYKRPLIVGGLIAFLIVAIITGVLLWLYFRTYESTDDAYVDIQSEHVAPRVQGRITRVLVDDNQDVAAGDLLVEIDPADYQIALDRAIAGQAQSQGKLSQAQAQVLVIDAQLEQAKANVEVAQANATKANEDLQRYEELRKIDPGAVSQQQYDNAAAQAKSTAAQLTVAQKNVAAADAQTRYAQSQVQAAQAELKSGDASVEQARLNLSYTKVRATLDGRIAEKTVAAGDFVQPGNELMAVVPKNVFITANFKETQLNKMRQNQPVQIEVDAYPSLKLHGYVQSIQPGTGQAFSVLPAQNATGNWVKIVQRVPVKIVLDHIPDDPTRLAPGMSVRVKVSIR